jgi:hypothetical protein
MDSNTIKALGGVIFAVGLVLGLIGFIGDVYSGTVATLLMLGVWFIGGALVGIVAGQGKRAVYGLVFAVGLIGGLIGYMTDVYSSTIATVIMLGVWLVGGAIARFLPSDNG